MHIIDHNLNKDGFMCWEDAITGAVEQIFEYSDSNQPIFDANNENIIYLSVEDGISFRFQKNNLDNLKNILDLYVNSKIYLNQNSDEKTKLLHKKIVLLLSSFAMCVAKDISMENGDFSYFKSNLIETLIRKQKDYGPTNIAKFGITGLVIRMYDKIGRLTNLTSNGNQPSVQNEPLLDSALDLLGYSSIAIMWLDDTFFLPMISK